jgi:hypothetical protein
MQYLVRIEFKGFWPWFIALRITGFLDFVHRSEFYVQENTTFRKLELFPFSGEMGETYTLLGPLELISIAGLVIGVSSC